MFQKLDAPFPVETANSCDGEMGLDPNACKPSSQVIVSNSKRFVVNKVLAVQCCADNRIIEEEEEEEASTSPETVPPGSVNVVAAAPDSADEQSSVKCVNKPTVPINISDLQDKLNMLHKPVNVQSQSSVEPVVSSATAAGPASEFAAPSNASQLPRMTQQQQSVSCAANQPAGMLASPYKDPLSLSVTQQTSTLPSRRNSNQQATQTSHPQHTYLTGQPLSTGQQPIPWTNQQTAQQVGDQPSQLAQHQPQAADQVNTHAGQHLTQNISQQHAPANQLPLSVTQNDPQTVDQQSVLGGHQMQSQQVAPWTGHQLSQHPSQCAAQQQQDCLLGSMVDPDIGQLQAYHSNMSHSWTAQTTPHPDLSSACYQLSNNTGQQPLFKMDQRNLLQADPHRTPSLPDQGAELAASDRDQLAASAQHLGQLTLQQQSHVIGSMHQCQSPMHSAQLQEDQPIQRCDQLGSEPAVSLFRHTAAWPADGSGVYLGHSDILLSPTTTSVPVCCVMGDAASVFTTRPMEPAVSTVDGMPWRAGVLQRGLPSQSSLSPQGTPPTLECAFCKSRGNDNAGSSSSSLSHRRLSSTEHSCPQMFPGSECLTCAYFQNGVPNMQDLCQMYLLYLQMMHRCAVHRHHSFQPHLHDQDIPVCTPGTQPAHRPESDSHSYTEIVSGDSSSISIHPGIPENVVISYADSRTSLSAFDSVRKGKPDLSNLFHLEEALIKTIHGVDRRSLPSAHVAHAADLHKPAAQSSDTDMCVCLDELTAVSKDNKFQSVLSAEKLHAPAAGSTSDDGRAGAYHSEDLKSVCWGTATSQCDLVAPLSPVLVDVDSAIQTAVAHLTEDVPDSVFAGVCHTTSSAGPAVAGGAVRPSGGDRSAVSGGRFLRCGCDALSR